MSAFADRAFSGVVWSLAQRGGTQILGFVVTVVMARLLTPSDYGLIGMLLIFMEVGEALASGGMTQALVARGLTARKDSISALLFNIFAGLSIYLILWIIAPEIASFYSEPQLEPLTRVVALTVPLRACACLPEARLMYHLAYRRRAVASILSLILSGAIGIIGAFSGLGVWAIAAYMVAQAALMLIFVNIAALSVEICPPQTSQSADRKNPKQLWKYGLNLIGARLADVAYINSYLIIIGRLFPVADVGLFTRARQFASVPSISMSEIVRQVSYPILCRFNTPADSSRRNQTFRKMTGMTMSVAFPIMLWLAFFAEPIVDIILGEKWISVAPYMTWLCLGMLWTPLDGLNLTLILASGNPSGLMKIEIVRKIIGLAILLISFRYGIPGICIGYAVASLIAMAITIIYAFYVSGDKFGSLSKTLGIPLLMALISAAAGWGCASIVSAAWLQLAIGLIVSGLLYLLLMHVAGIETLKEIFAKAKIMIIRRQTL